MLLCFRDRVLYVGHCLSSLTGCLKGPSAAFSVAQAVVRSGAFASSGLADGLFKRPVGSIRWRAHYFPTFGAPTSFPCVPSQYGPSLVCLQPHRYTVSSFSATNTIGFKSSVCLWVPSQNGCLALKPQLHQAYFWSVLRDTLYGLACATTGSVIWVFLCFW